MCEMTKFRKVEQMKREARRCVAADGHPVGVVWDARGDLATVRPLQKALVMVASHPEWELVESVYPQEA